MLTRLLLCLGTGVSLYGEFLPIDDDGTATYSVALDGTPTTNFAFSNDSPVISDNILAAFSNLSYGEHTVELTLHNPKSVFDGTVMLQVDRVVVVGEVPPQSSASGMSLSK